MAIRRAKGSVGFFESSVADWAKDASGGDDTLRQEFATANAAVIAATKDFAGGWKRICAACSRGSYAIGAENFLAKLKYEELVEVPCPSCLPAARRTWRRTTGRLSRRPGRSTRARPPRR